ncbi:MAG TPA: hypothetical protein VNN79_12145 [Actinomycetota bacterium]|nr:hypothetical protein [Actinomycetota bacterium]
MSTSATPTGNPYIDRLNGTQGMVNSAANNLAGVDRTKLAEQMFQTFSNATAPQYTAALRQATQRGAAGGQVGSGQLRTTYGDLANQRNLQLQTEEQGLQENATQGSIQDAFNKLSALSGLEGQQFGESNTLSQEAQNAAAQQYQQEMEGQAQNFNEGAELQQLGQSGNPAEYYTQMASQLGVDPTTLMLLGQGLGTQSAYGGARSPAANPGLKIPSLPTGPGNINIQTNQPAYGGTAVG